MKDEFQIVDAGASKREALRASAPPTRRDRRMGADDGGGDEEQQYRAQESV